MIKPHRKHPLWFAFLLHRVSGVLLALFLPVHFYVLALALTEPAALDGFFLLTENIWVKIAEFGLVFLLAAHMLGGLRLMAMEWLPWSNRQKTFAATAMAGAFFISCGFFLSAVQG